MTISVPYTRGSAMDGADGTLSDDARAVAVLRAKLRAEKILNPKTDMERQILMLLFEVRQSPNVSHTFYSQLPSHSTAGTIPSSPSGTVRKLASLIDGAIVAEEMNAESHASDAYLFDDQASITVPTEWLSEMRAIQVVEDEDFDLPWADG